MLIKQEVDKRERAESQQRLLLDPAGEEGLVNRRGTIDHKDFYENRPNNAIFMETSREQDERVRKNSPFGQLKTWRLIKIIVKSNDDVR